MDNPVEKTKQTLKLKTFGINLPSAALLDLAETPTEFNPQIDQNEAQTHQQEQSPEIWPGPRPSEAQEQLEAWIKTLPQAEKKTIVAQAIAEVEVGQH